MPDLPAFARLSPTGLSLFVRVTPNAGSDAIDGPDTRDDGSTLLRLRVRAVPDKGQANAAVIALLAKALHLPKSGISLTQGATARHKTLFLHGDPAELAARISTCLG